MNEPTSFCDGRFIVLRKLGEGGMAVVYLCWDTLLGRRVAIKTPHVNLLIHQKTMQRFTQETLAMARMVSCANVVQLLDAQKDALPDGSPRPVLVIEWVDAVGLDVAVIGSKSTRAFGPLPARAVCRVGFGLLKALSRMHALGVVHRDVKPSNLMLCDDVALPPERGFDVKLMDFGIARLMELSDEERQTQTSGAMGTFSYMAPEQRLRPREAGPKADLYSVGATLYGIATGYDPGDLFLKELDSEEFRDLPEPLRGPVFRATRYEVGDRSPDTAAEFLAELETALAALSKGTDAEPAFVDRTEQVEREAALRAWLAERRAAAEALLVTSREASSSEPIPVPTAAAESVERGLTVWFQKEETTPVPPPAPAVEPTPVPPPAPRSFLSRNVAYGTFGFGLIALALAVGFRAIGPGAREAAEVSEVAKAAQAETTEPATKPAVPAVAPPVAPPVAAATVSVAQSVGTPATPTRPTNASKPVAQPTVVPPAPAVDPPTVVVPPPVVAAVDPPHGTVHFDGGAQAVRFVGTDGVEHAPGRLVPGTYQIKATFEGKGAVVAGTLTVLDGQTQSVRCNDGFYSCKAN